MAFDRVKARFGWNDEAQRYPDTDDFTPPQQVEDPHTIEDGTDETLVDKLLEYRWWAVSVSLLGLALLILVGIYFGRYFATALANPWVQRFGVAGVLVVGARRWGRSSERAQFEKLHELTLYDPDEGEAIHFTGRFRRVDGATHDTFIPYKGRRRGSGEPYRVGELSSSLVKQHNRSPDEPAEIRLHNSLVSTRQTERGLKVTQLTGGLEPDPFGQESNLKATIPRLAARDSISELKQQLEKLDEELQDLREENDQLRRQRNNARAEAKKNYDEVRREIQKDADMLEPFVRGRRGGTTNGDSTDDNPERLERKRDEIRNGDGS